MSSSTVLLRMALAVFKVTQQLAIRELLDVSSLFRTFMEALFIVGVFLNAMANVASW
jgi:hypothetical protein